MKSLLNIVCLIGLTVSLAYAQSTTKTLPSFDKVVVSPLIKIVLVSGNQETVRLEYENVAPEKVNCFVRDNTLRLYLDDAKIVVKQERVYDGENSNKRPIYGKDVKVTAYITYRQLKELEVRGEEEAVCQSDITGDVFKLRVYGQATVTLASLHVTDLRAHIYGENKVTIQSGNADEQVYRVYGESQINAENLVGKNVSTSLYGDSQLRLYASNRLGVTAFGESNVNYTGGASLQKGLVLGDVKIRKSKPE
jgi:hypothetical protein